MHSADYNYIVLAVLALMVVSVVIGLPRRK